ncbi:hypothetical protein G9A89_001971 [Geosiphon pyriformis]|nr:hypothetical protein G9A89_001971 [Geosiphon pyriformis]
MAAKAKNSKKQQQAVTTAMITLNFFVVPDKIFVKISTVAASLLPNMDGNSSSTSFKMGQDQPLAVLPDMVLSSRSLPISVAKQPINLDDLKNWADQMEMESTVPSPVSGAVDDSAWENVNGHQRFSGWVASNLVLGATFKIKMALLGFLFQLLPGCIGLKSVSQDAVKLFCIEFASQESLNGATKVAINDEIFLTTLKIAWSSGVASVSSSFLSIALYDVLLGTSSDDIKTALGIFGVQYVVVNFKNISFAAATLSNWSVLVRKDSVKILSITNQKEVISLRDAFKAKLVNLPVGCIAFEISDLVFQCHHCYRCQDLNHLAVNCKKLPPLPPKLSFNTFGGPKNFKSLVVGSKSYVKTAAFVVPSGAAAADINLDLGGPPKTTTPMLLSLLKLSVLIKSLVEPVGVQVTLVTKLLSISFVIDVSVKECVDELAKQNKGLAVVASMIQKRITHLEKKYKQTCLENAADNDDMVDNDDDNNKDFSVYDDTFNVMMYLWEDYPSSIKSSPNQTAKWMSSMVKNSHELVSIMDKMYKLDMFDTLSSKDSTSV